MPDLTTASEYVERFGYPETGDLLTKEDVISEPSDESVAAYKAVMETNGSLNADVVTAINLYIDEAEALVKLYISGRYIYPPVNVDSVLKNAALHIARYLFYDNHDRNDIPDNITAMYEKYFKVLLEIKNGNVNLDITQKDTTILYAI